MMNKEQIIEKIMEEYGKYGLVRGIAEIVYDNAINLGVPQEVIYQGMRYQFNIAYEIDNKDTIKEIARGYMKNAINESMKSNPTATKKMIRQNIAEEILNDGVDTLDNIEEIFPNIREACKKEARKFVKKYV